MTATKVEDADDSHDLLDSAQDNFLAREQAVLGDDADFFQSGGTTSSPPAQGEASFFDGGHGTFFPLFSFADVQMKKYMNLNRAFLL